MRMALLGLLAASGFAAIDAAAQEARPKPEIGLAAGQEVPFFVVDFCHGEHSGHAGCPGVMTSNAMARGVLLFSRAADEPARQLAKELDAKLVDGKQVKGFLIVIGGTSTELAKQCQDDGLKHFIAGIPRDQSLDRLKQLGLSDEVFHAVVLLDRKLVKASYLLKRGELTAEKQKEIVAALAGP